MLRAQQHGIGRDSVYGQMAFGDVEKFASAFVTQAANSVFLMLHDRCRICTLRFQYPGVSRTAGILNSCSEIYGEQRLEVRAEACLQQEALLHHCYHDSMCVYISGMLKTVEQYYMLQSSKSYSCVYAGLQCA